MTDGTLIRITEAGNGFPQYSDPLINDEGEVWQIISFEGPIQTKQWEANWLLARAEYVRDAEEGDEGFPCSWRVEEGDVEKSAIYPYDELDEEEEEEEPSYTYTVFDGNPASSGGVEWPSHTDLELSATDREEALTEAQAALESAALECAPEHGYDVGDTLYLELHCDGEWVASLTYDLTAEDLGLEDLEEEEDVED